MAKFMPTVLVDTREQTPWYFDNLPSEIETLQTGDYSIKGLERHVMVERKSLPDLLGVIGSGRSRFKRELDRMLACRFRLLVIETSAATIEAGDWRSMLKPAHVFGSLAAWTAQYNLPIWLGGTHTASGLFAERFLFQSARCIRLENESLGELEEC